MGSLSYIKSSLFGLPQNDHAESAAVSSYKCSADSKVQIIDKVHKHVCGHSSYSDMVMLLKRSNIWDESVEDYLQQTVSRCDSCRAATPTLPMRKVSIKGLSDPFNRTIQVDHMFLDGNPVLHIMEHPHRYSIGIPVSSTDVRSAMDAIESRWFTEFWPPQFVN